MTTLSPKQEELCRQRRWDFSNLRAVYINGTLERSPERSHTQPAHGNQRSEWDAGCRFDLENPEHR